ncbi:MAG TPA: hypothetical protein VGN16_13380 [Acidobacteriaceae bacterium]|jgi:hypothetical protein
MTYRYCLGTVLALLCITTGCSNTAEAAGNRLLGTWNVVQKNGCAETVTFYPHSSKAHYGAIGPHAAYDSNLAVHYLDANTDRITVVGEGTGSGGEIWVLTDATHATTGSADQCKYVKQ